MKPTGIVRKVDGLGRIVIPKELRDTFNINDKEPLEIFISNEGHIILKKYTLNCASCGNDDDLLNVNGIKLCRKCAKLISEKL